MTILRWIIRSTEMTRKCHGTVIFGFMHTGGYTLVEAGVLYAYDNSIPEETFVYTDGSNGIKRYVSTARKNLGAVGLSARVDFDSQNVSMRGYMLVRDPDGKVGYYYTTRHKDSPGSGADHSAVMIFGDNRSICSLLNRLRSIGDFDE